MMLQGSPRPQKGAMWDGEHQRPSIRDDEKKELNKKSSAAISTNNKWKKTVFLVFFRFIGQILPSLFDYVLRAA